MKNETLSKIKQLYTTNLKEKGIASSAVGWNSLESQELRFDKLTQVVSNDGTPFTVNDYGCGYGAHLSYLIDKKFLVIEYFGYDISREMIECAKLQHSEYNGILDLHCSDKLTTKADYTFVSGTFNVRFDATDDEWKVFIINKLHEINEYSKLGFSFNLLSTYVDWKEPHLYYGDPLFFFDYCKTNFSKAVTLLHDYKLYEWTILIKKW